MAVEFDFLYISNFSWVHLMRKIVLSPACALACHGMAQSMTFGHKRVIMSHSQKDSDKYTLYQSM